MIQSSEKSSYSQILKASSIIGGAAGISLLLGLVRTKFAAVLIGTSGVGLLASYTAVQGVIGTIAGLGIQSSAVRDVAAAVGKNDEQAIGRAILTLRRICWLTGLAGMLATMLLSPFISLMTFGSEQFKYDIAALGVVILMVNLSGGQMALIQGMRRIGDMARASVLGAAFSTLAAISFYAWLGIRGVVPALVAIAIITLLLSWQFARKVPAPKVDLSWRETFNEAGGMVKLGLIFMWSGLLGSAVTYITVTLVTQSLGVQAVGIYSAAFALSGMFVNFVLGAMGADYYPRLTALAEDKGAMNRLINEQTEVGLLVALPGLLATMAMAPWIVHVFYTKEFLPAVELLHWFVLGCLGRVISWPLGYIMLAMGKGRWFLLTETTFNFFHMILIFLGLLAFGVKGVAIAFFVMYLCYSLAVFFVARHLTEFVWSKTASKLGVVALTTLILTFLIVESLPIWPATIGSGLVFLVGGLYSLRGLILRIGTDHRISRAAFKVPGLRAVCGL
jgi:antigen flippase